MSAAQSRQDFEAPPSKRYSLGVLFVHGIGEQPMGETLRNVADPLVQSLDLWLHGAARCRAIVAGEQGVKDWVEALPAGLPNTAREQALEMAAAAEWNHTHLLAGQAEDVAAGRHWSGGAVLRDGSLQQDPGGAGEPTRAVLHLHTLDVDHVLRQAEVLIAESWWARRFLPPGSWALMGWTVKVLPLAIGMHLGDGVRRHGLKALDKAAGLFARLFHAVLALLWFFVAATLVPLAGPLQLVLVASVLLAMLPLRFVQATMGALQSVLTSVLGDSHCLVASPTARAMIVSQCRRDLEWLSSQCREVMVVAHSQGCAVSYMALCESLPHEVREVTWVGSGLRKLEILRAAERDGGVVLAGWLAATMPLLLWGFGHNLLHHEGTLQNAGSQIFFAACALLAWTYGIVRVLFTLRAGATDLWLSVWRGLQLRITELFASHDPIPNGPLHDRQAEAPVGFVSREVHNRASMLSDHTGYWRNLEEVVFPLALRIAQRAGVPMHGLLAGDDAWCRYAQSRRLQRVRWLSRMRLVLMGGAALAIWQKGAAWWAFMQLLVQQVVAFGPDDPAGHGAVASAAKSLLPELLWWIALPYAVLSLAWRWWDVHEQRAFLLRRHPNPFLETLTVAAMSAATFTPAGRAATLAWGDAAAGAAIAFIVVGSMATGLFFGFSQRGPQR